MQKVRRHLSRHKVGIMFVTVITMSGLTLSACAGPDSPSNAESGKSVSALQKILNRGVIDVGFCVGYPPWGLSNAKGEPDGFDVDLAKEYATYLKVKLNLVEVTSVARIPSLETQKVDMVSCAFTANDERRKKIDFTDPTLAQGQSLMVLKGSPIRSVADLTGKKVGVNKGGTAADITKAANPAAKLQYYDSSSAAALAVAQGQADAEIDTSGVINTDVKKFPQLEVVNDGGVGPKVYFALGVRHGVPDLLKSLNGFIKEWHQSGNDVKLYTKWFGSAPTYEMSNLPAPSK